MNVNKSRHILSVTLLALSISGYPAVAMITKIGGLSPGYLTIPFRGAVVALSVATIGIILMRGRFPKGAIPLIAFMMVYLLKIAFETPILLEDARNPVTFYLATTLLPALAISISAIVNKDESDLQKWMLALGAVTVLGYYATGGDTSDYLFGGRASLETLNPISLGQAAASFGICGAILAMNAKRFGGIALGLAIVFAAIGILISAASKGPILCFALACLWLWRLSLRGLAVITTLAIAAYIVSQSDNIIVARFTDSFAFADQSSLSRLDAQEVAIGMFLAHPLFGARSALPDGGYPHNLFIEVAMAMGIVGLTLLAVVLASAFRCLSHDRPLSSALLIQYFLAVQFSGGIWGSSHFYCLLAYVLVAGVKKGSSRQTSRVKPDRVPV